MLNTRFYNKSWGLRKPQLLGERGTNRVTGIKLKDGIKLKRGGLSKTKGKIELKNKNSWK
ncbi:MAG: hypothetical protein Q8N17_21320 [Burkholderiaceae bacterium]|nr:hypothetical protein [Burkholderiaceae bacterium]